MQQKVNQEIGGLAHTCVEKMSREMRKRPSRDKAAPNPSISDIYFKSKELEKQGADVIHFDVGEPDYEPPQQVVEATSKALNSCRGRYTSPGGIFEVRSALAEHLSSRFGVEISSRQVLLTSGGRMGLFLALSSLQNNLRIGIIAPDWPAYREMSSFLSFETVTFETLLEDEWNPSANRIRDAHCDALVLNYPNNPTGKMLDTNTFEEIAQNSERDGVALISDEVYSDFVLTRSKKFHSVLELLDKKKTKEEKGKGGFIYTSSFSKSYAMTGYRAGIVVSDEATVSRMEKVNGLILTSVPEFVQYGVLATIDCSDYVAEKVTLIKRRKERAIKALRSLVEAEFYAPDGSLYIFPRLHFRTTSSSSSSSSSERETLPRGRFDSLKAAYGLLEREHVSLTPGCIFGSRYNEFVRLTLLQNEDRIEKGIERIARFLGF